MCYHTALTATPSELAARFGRRADRIVGFRPAYHVSAFRHEEYPVVTSDAELALLRWGLIPFWTDSVADAAAIRNRTANARAETLFRKPAFREAARRRRCLVPVSGFFDWRLEGSRKIPYYITMPREPVFALAGIYEWWNSRELGETVGTYAVVTTEANELMRYIHNRVFRMPAVLARGDEERWLAPDLSEAEALELLRPLPDGLLEGRPVAGDFLRRNPFDPGIVEGVGAAVR